MDYEKEYKEARDRAIKVIMRCRTLSTEANLAVSYALSYVFPTTAGDKSEDERVRTRLIALVEAFGQGKYKDEMLAYLEKQKEQKPAEWSKEDEDYYYEVMNKLQSDLLLNKDEKTWLKSLRPQPHWKPSKEQMDALYILGQCVVSPELKTLFFDLKKLM